MARLAVQKLLLCKRKKALSCVGVVARLTNLNCIVLDPPTASQIIQGIRRLRHTPESSNLLRSQAKHQRLA